jgi:DNA-binding NtrC family response regulator
MTTACIPSTLVAPNVRSPERPTLLNLLIVDDDRFVREACREAAVALGYSGKTTESIEQAMWMAESQSIDVVLLGAKLTDTTQLEILQRFKERHPGIEVIMMTNCGSVRSAVKAMKCGAYDVIVKPFGLADLKQLLLSVGNHLKAKTESRPELEKSKSARGFGNMVGRAPEMEKLYRMIVKAGRTAHPVLITGESGTGKEMVARALHYSGPSRDKPFIPVDCGSLVPTLIESELFGYVKGAFTGAMQSKQGLLAIAEGGTVFLDEVGELPLDLQSKLLRALQGTGDPASR